MKLPKLAQLPPDYSSTHCLKALFAFLNRHNIPYCVVGDPRGLPGQIDSDIDIIITDQDLPKMGHKLQQFASEQNCLLVQALQHEDKAFYFVLSLMDHQPQVEFLLPDICSDYYRSGKPLLSATGLLTGRQLYPEQLAATDSHAITAGEAFYIPACDAEFIYYLIKKIEKGRINQHQYQHLRHQYLLAPEKCQARAAQFWSQGEVAQIKHCLASIDVDPLLALLPALRQGIASRCRPSLNDRWQEFKRILRRASQPTGLVIALLGPDGAGKTAIGNRLQQVLAPAFRGQQRIHLRPDWFNRQSAAEARPAVTDPHQLPPRGAVASIAKLGYFLADYTLGYLLWIRQLKIRSHLVIFDRYYHDLLLDPQRYRYGGPRWLVRAIGRLIPEPDLFVILDAPASVIQSRKQEVSLEETNRQRQAYLQFAAGRQNAIVLNTDTPLESTVAEGTEAILGYMQQRLQQRQSKLNQSKKQGKKQQ